VKQLNCSKTSHRIFLLGHSTAILVYQLQRLVARLPITDNLNFPILEAFCNIVCTEFQASLSFHSALNCSLCA
jgi:hypothetical protein